MPPRGIVIAIDGPAGAGKSTVARRVAHRLDLARLDTGSMYRALTWKALQEGTDLDSEKDLTRLARRLDLDFARDGITVDGRTREREIRAPRVSSAVSSVSVHPSVRRVLVRMQQQFARQGNVVIEGRDIGTVVAPNADLKVFLTASASERARRRQKDLLAAGHPVSLGALTAQIKARDARDTKTTPLVPAPDAVAIDSTSLSLREVVACIVDLAGKLDRTATRKQR